MTLVSPIAPPSAMGDRFDPRYLTDEDLEDVSSFTGLDIEHCRARIEGYSVTEMAATWRAADPRGSADLLAFYKSAELYIWEQLQWHASPDREPYWRALEQLVESFPPTRGYRRVLDFGAGIGSDALFLATHGYDITLVDVDGPAFRFARHRFKRRGLRARFFESRGMLPKPDSEYDIVISFDVFEHLTDPLLGARRLVAALQPGGVLVQTGSFVDEGNQPCHLREGIDRFSDGRWERYLTGLGLSGGIGGVFVKSRFPVSALQRVRYWGWRTTGLWISRAPR